MQFTKKRKDKTMVQDFEWIEENVKMIQLRTEEQMKRRKKTIKGIL